jgi:hypothetical protein
MDLSVVLSSPTLLNECSFSIMRPFIHHQSELPETNAY